MKIKICKKFSKTNKLQHKLTKAFPHDTIVIKKCIDLCKICEHQPLAQVRGEKLKASRISKLIQIIETKYK